MKKFIFISYFYYSLDFNGANAQKYSDDIQTLNFIINTFPRDITNWSIATAEISFASDSNEIAVFANLVRNKVASIGWIE